MVTVFQHRRAAGRALLGELRGQALDRPIVLALPRGGVPVGFEVASGLGAPLDVFVVRKLGAPMQPELALGAIASGGVRVLNEDLLARMPELDPDTLDAIAATERRELERRERAYRGVRPYPDLAGRDVILVDDGIATGATMRAAIAGIRTLQPRRITVAVPVAPPEALADLERRADRVVCLLAPDAFQAVGQYYRDFGQTSDDEVSRLIGAAVPAAAR